MNKESLDKARTYLLEALLDRGKAIPDDVGEPARRAIYMLNFNDEKIKDAIRILDKMIQSLKGKANESE